MAFQEYFIVAKADDEADEGGAAWTAAQSPAAPTNLGTAFLRAVAEDVCFCANGDYNLPNGRSISGSGSIANNTKIYFIGFNTTAGTPWPFKTDMDYGGFPSGANFHQTPIDALINGVDTTRCCNVTGDNNAIDLITIDGKDGIEFRHFYFHNTSAASGRNLFQLVNTPVSLTFIDCKFDDAYRAFDGTAINLSLIECYIANSIANRFVSITGDGLTIFNSIFNGAASPRLVWVAGITTIRNNIFIDGQWGLAIQSSLCNAHNNLFYGTTEYCIIVNNAAATLIEFNNLFMPAVVDDFAVYIGSGAGSVLYSNYSWAYNLSGNPFSVNPWHDASNNRSFKGRDSVQNVNPLLQSPVAGQFRPFNNSVKAALPDLHDFMSWIGPIQAERLQTSGVLVAAGLAQGDLVANNLVAARLVSNSKISAALRVYPDMPDS